LFVTLKKIDNFWQPIKNTVSEKYDLNSLEDFLDKEIMPFDARRLNWEEILPMTGKTPSRLYLPIGLKEKDIYALDRRFASIGFTIPKVGYYDSKAETRFTEYKVVNI